MVQLSFKGYFSVEIETKNYFSFSCFLVCLCYLCACRLHGAIFCARKFLAWWAAKLWKILTLPLPRHHAIFDCSVSEWRLNRAMQSCTL